MSDRVYSLEELIELVPELADAADFACFPVEEAPRARVVHVNDNVPGAVYIGRAMPRRWLAESQFHNPFKIDSWNNRATVIERFAAHLNLHRMLYAELPKLRGKPLACWCRHDGEAKTPDNACHGDVLVGLLDRYTDDELRATAGGPTA